MVATKTSNKFGRQSYSSLLGQSHGRDQNLQVMQILPPEVGHTLLHTDVPLVRGLTKQSPGGLRNGVFTYPSECKVVR